MDYFARAEHEYRTTPTAPPMTTLQVVQWHAVRMIGEPDAVSVCGRAKELNDADETDKDFNTVNYASRCPACQAGGA